MINADGKGYNGGSGPRAGGRPAVRPAAAGALWRLRRTRAKPWTAPGRPMAFSSNRWRWAAAAGRVYDGPGGTGGGKIKLTAGGIIRVDGAVTANGGNGFNERSAADRAQHLSERPKLRRETVRSPPMAERGSRLKAAAAAAPDRPLVRHDPFCRQHQRARWNGYVRGRRGHDLHPASSRGKPDRCWWTTAQDWREHLTDAIPAELLVSCPAGRDRLLPVSQIGSLVLASNAWISSSMSCLPSRSPATPRSRPGGHHRRRQRLWRGPQATGPENMPPHLRLRTGGGGYGVTELGRYTTGLSGFRVGGSTYGIVTRRWTRVSGGGYFTLRNRWAGGGALRLTVTGSFCSMAGSRPMGAGAHSRAAVAGRAAAFG